MGTIYTELLSQSLAIAADGIHPASQSTSEKLTGAIDLGKFMQLFFVIDSGIIGASGTLDFQLKASATSGGSYTAIPNTSITQLVVTTNANGYACVCVTNEYVQSLNLGYAWLKGSLVPGTAASLASVVVIGAVGNYEPTKLKDASTVFQTLSISNAAITSTSP